MYIYIYTPFFSTHIVSGAMESRYPRNIWPRGVLELVCRYSYHKGIYVVLVWWLVICNLKYIWAYEGLWTPQYPPNQPRVIHDWFPFQQKDWIRFWIYHQNNQPEMLEIQVHIRSISESCHVGPIPHHHHLLIFKCIQHIRYIPHPLYVVAMPLMKLLYRYYRYVICISVIIICIYVFLFIHISIILYLYSYPLKP